MDAAQGTGGAHSHTNLLAVAETLLHIPGRQPVLGLLTPSAANPGRIRVRKQRAGRNRTFGSDPVSGLLRLRDLQLRADSQEAGGSTYKLISGEGSAQADVKGL